VDPEDVRRLLEAVQRGDASVEDALSRLRDWPMKDLGFAVVDHHRALRCGFPEVVLAEGKTPEQVARIAAEIARSGSNLLVTRVQAEQLGPLRAAVPSGSWNELGRVFTLKQREPERRGARPVVVVTAGTSDLAVAEEAAATAEIMGNEVARVTDVGVAGIHRLLPHVPALATAGVIIVVAGMEGALASVVAGMVDRPVIAVPTSVGYGASFRGLAALLGMLCSCAAGVAVVNIDNGFGAGYAASRINLAAPGAR